jgi:UDP-N-acetylmuramate dehydrogenase
VEVEVINSISNYDDFYIIGKANNLLVNDKPKAQLAILGKEFSYIKEEDGLIKIGASMVSGKIFSFAKKNNLTGFEYLSKLPGTLGGLIKMNAGMGSNEIFNTLKAVKTKDGYIEKKDIDFGYRYVKLDDIIYEAIFYKKIGFDYKLLDFFSNIRDKQPNKPSAGSLFKNPKNDFAGRLIEDVGLKGKIVGGASLSEKHANFLVNLGGATFDDAMTLAILAKQEVYKKFNITLEYEVDIIR